VTKFLAGTILTCHKMDSQMHSIGKAIRPLFTDLVTYIITSAHVMYCTIEGIAAAALLLLIAIFAVL